MDSQTTEMALPMMPTELVTEIISYALASGINKQLIASVSKAWRAIIIGTPRFWRQIKIYSWVLNDVSLKQLKRALQLSGSVTLDVDLATTFSINQMLVQDQLLQHFRVLADAGLHRWRSLTLIGGQISSKKPSQLFSIFTGKLSSLRSLSIIQGDLLPGQQGIYEPIYSLITETRPDLHNFSYVPGQAPEMLTRLPIYGNLKSIITRAENIAKVRPKFDVPDLHITNTYPLDAFEAFNLPHTTTFGAIRFSQLSECGLDSVQVLKIQLLYYSNDRDSNLPVLILPNLRVLEVHVNLYEDRLLWLLDTETPKLSDLSLISSNPGDSQVTDGTIYHIYKTEKDRIKMWPTRLYLGICLTVTSTLQVLKQWPQIQDLTLYWDSKFKWDGKLLTELCNRDRSSNGLCPDLDVLRIVMWPKMWPEEDIVAWLQAARQILKARKDASPLWRITLADRRSSSVLHSITIFDVDQGIPLLI